MNGDSEGKSGQQQHATETRQPKSWKEKLRKLRPPSTGGVSVSFEMLLLSAVVYGVLVFCIGKAFLPGSPAFATLVIWICSVVAAEIAHFLRIPRVVGMLGAGLLLANVPGTPVDAFPAKWGVQMRAAALATIFLRCGLELEFKTIALYKWPALRLAFLPGLAEALFDAGIASAVFSMPFTLALSLGFILKAVGPGLVVPAMFQLQKQGLGANKGIPSTVVIAASFDDIIAITGFSIFINVAIATGDNAAWQIASGPLQVVFGMAGGIIAGIVLGATRVFDNKAKRLLGIYSAALLVMFFLEYYDMLSGGALGSLTVGLVTCYMWENGKPGRLSTGANNTYSAEVERVMAVVWNWVMEPMLFATIGTSIVFSNLPSGTIPKSVLVVVTGLCLRTFITWFVMGKRRYSWKERLFFAIAWTPKATVQASLSAVPLSLIDDALSNDPNYAQWQKWGKDILATGIFAIIICATLGTLFVYWLAPVLLDKTEDSGRNLYRMSKTRTDSRNMIRQMSLSNVNGQHSLMQSHGHGDVDPLALMLDMREASDHTIINEYFDAIEKLVVLVMRGGGGQAKEEGLCERVLALQDAIEKQVGPRELTVRQMLHSAALRSRQPAITASTADQLVRLSLSDLGDNPHPALLELSGNSPRAMLQGASPRAQQGSSTGGFGGGSSGGCRGSFLGGAAAAAAAGDVEAGQLAGLPLESIGSTAGPPAVLVAGAPAASPCGTGGLPGDGGTAGAAGGVQQQWRGTGG